MLTIIYRSRFKKDYKTVSKRGKDLKKLQVVIQALVNEVPLPEKYKDHWLIGNYEGRRECHIEPDWLLIYKIADSAIILERTGTHTDLFE